MNEIEKRHVGEYYIVASDEGIFKTGQRCYIFSENLTHVWASFEFAVLGTINQIKIPKEKIKDKKVFKKI